MPTSSASLVFLLLLVTHAHMLLCGPHGRRILHEPFFPADQSPTAPPAEPPAVPFPNDPSSSNSQPFFPQYPSPPPPPPSASYQPTFPANISSVFPNSTSASSHRSSSGKLTAAVVLPLLALILLSLSLAFFLRRHRCRRSPSAAGDKTCFFPANYSSSSSDGGDGDDGGGGGGCKPCVIQPASDFLFVDSFAGSRSPPVLDPSAVAETPEQKLGSPELRPLPPLARQFRQNYSNVDGQCSSEEEFYSPRGSSAGRGSSNPTEFTPPPPPAAFGRGTSQSETLSETPSYPTSNSGSVSSPPASSPPVSSTPPSSSPEKFIVKSISSRSNSEVSRDDGIRPSAAIPPPPRPMTPSPPKRKPPLPSPPSSPQDAHPDLRSSNLKISFQKEKNTEIYPLPSTSFQNVDSPARNGDLPANPIAVSSSPTERKAPPPPPPPPPPTGYWESKVRRPQVIQQKGLVSPNPAASNSCTVAEFHLEKQDESFEAEEKNGEAPRPKLKPLHWDKVRASSDRVMVWDQLKSSSFQVNEEMMESLFGCNVRETTPKKSIRKQALSSPKQEKLVLDAKKSQNIAILLRALNVTKEEVCDALLEGKTEKLGSELLETLLKMSPRKEEENKLREYIDDSHVKLGLAEKFLLSLIDIPFAFKRIDALLYIINFDSEVNYLKKSFETLEAACEELRTSRLFLKLLEAVLKTGNRMNIGTNRGDAHAFKLDTLLKLVDIKGTDGRTSLLHFVVQEIIKAEGSRLSESSPSSTRTQSNTLCDDLRCRKLGLQVIARLGGELGNVKKAASMDSEVLGSYVSKLAGGIGKINDVLRLNEELCTSKNASRCQQFQEAMSGFMKKAEDEIIKVQAQESVALSLVKEITEYFHGNSTKEEAHPFRIFMVVRDFLSILDRVCKEVGRITDQSIASSTRHFPVPVNPTLPSVFPRIRALRPESSDDEGSTSSLSS